MQRLAFYTAPNITFVVHIKGNIPIVGHTPSKDLQFTAGFGKINILDNAFESLRGGGGREGEMWWGKEWSVGELR